MRLMTLYTAKACAYFSVIAGSSGTAIFLMDMNPGVIILLLLAIYGIVATRFNAHTSKATIDYYMFRDVDKSVPKLRHAQSKRLKQKSILLGLVSLSIVLLVIFFGVVVLSAQKIEYTLSGMPYAKGNVMWIAMPLFTIFWGGQALYCRMVYRSLV